MSAERGWIGEPQPQTQWQDSHYSRQADKITAKSVPQPERTDEDKDRLATVREANPADPTNN